MTAAEMATPDAYLLSHSAMPSRRAAYDLSSDGLSSALRGAGYAKDEVNKLFKSWGGKFADDVSDIDWTDG
jgi:hypothetical protein